MKTAVESRKPMWMTPDEWEMNQDSKADVWLTSLWLLAGCAVIILAIAFPNQAKVIIGRIFNAFSSIAHN